MLNINSPTVQLMLANTPMGFGNIPMYNGATPTITEGVSQVNNNTNQQNPIPPYPSPKDMVTGSNFYQQTQFAPSPTPMQVGAMNTPFLGGMNQQPYHPGTNYYNQPYNPYIGGANQYQQGYYQGYQQPQYTQPHHNQYEGYSYDSINNYYYENGNINGPMYAPSYFEDSPAIRKNNIPSMNQDYAYRMEAACINGVSYQKQLEYESYINKRMSRICSNFLGKSEEDAKRCEERYSIKQPQNVNTNQNYGYGYNSYNQYNNFNSTPVKTMSVKIVKGDETLADSKDKKKAFYAQPIGNIGNLIIQNERHKQELERTRYNMHMSAPERKMDNMSLFEFFGEGLGSLIAMEQQKEFAERRAKAVASSYNKKSYMSRLLKNNNLKSDSPPHIIRGRYGIMPNGKPVSPGVDPSIAECFSLNTETGQLSVTAPDFLSNRFEQARSSFVQSLGREEGSD